MGKFVKIEKPEIPSLAEFWPKTGAGKAGLDCGRFGSGAEGKTEGRQRKGGRERLEDKDRKKDRKKERKEGRK